MVRPGSGRHTAGCAHCINTLFSGDWYIHQMQGKMNQSEPLPITMPYDKYKSGTRDYIPYSDAKFRIRLN